MFIGGLSAEPTQKTLQLNTFDEVYMQNMQAKKVILLLHKQYSLERGPKRTYTFNSVISSSPLTADAKGIKYLISTFNLVHYYFLIIFPV